MSQSNIFDIAVVGGGIVGLASAYKIQLHHPNLKIVVIEKEDALAAHQTGNNSGVIHSGLYYKPGSHKAKNCVSGRKELVEFAVKHHIPHDVCGKVVVATQESELPYMDKIYQNGIANNVEGMEKITPAQVREIEPFCTNAVAGIRVPTTGIIDYVAVTKKLAELIVGIQPESKILLGQEVISFVRADGIRKITTTKGTLQAKRMIFCGGLHSDRLAKKDNVKLDMSIVGFRGDYYELTKEGMHKVKHLIYPVPNPAFPFLGVHFTRMIQGGVECGPNAVFIFKREGYKKFSFNLKDTYDALAFSGTWKLFMKNWKFGIDEWRRANSKRLFHTQLKRLIPSLTMEDLEPGRAGVRAMALGDDGNMIDDFKIEYKDDCIHVLNAPSPACTASLSIGERVSEMADQHFALV